MNPHFFTAPFYFAFIWFRVQGSGLSWRLRRLFLEDGILISQHSPLGNAIKLSGRTFLAPHRGSCPEGLCKRTGFLGVKRRENPVRLHILPSALPPKGEARRYVANDFLNLIALPQKRTAAAVRFPYFFSFFRFCLIFRPLCPSALCSFFLVGLYMPGVTTFFFGLPAFTRRTFPFSS